MKIHVDIDAEPQELRAFFGLPDLGPMQTAILEDVQRRMLEDLDAFSTTGLLREWFAPAAGMQQAFWKLFDVRSHGSSAPADAEEGTE
ncbi:MAG: hypothetical protein CSA58_06380 [Micrococcales bacterium]|nr:MAG: hypothetical protein CSB46_09440 [Micrococcales bacterium]PIE26984.1 MAG: hypothetical protein CSA58_06380 [Micrococcales bacterium]